MAKGNTLNTIKEKTSQHQGGRKDMAEKYG